MLLPNLTTEADYRAVFKDDAVWLPAIRVICENEGLEFRSLERPTLGTNVVFRNKDRIIKLFPPLWPRTGLPKSLFFQSSVDYRHRKSSRAANWRDGPILL